MLERFWVNCGSGDLLCFTLLKLDYICQQLNIFSTRRERREEWMSKKLLFSASMTSTTFYLIKQSKFGWVEWRWNYEMNYWSVLYRTEEGTEIEIHPNWICVCVCVCVSYVICQTPHHRVEIFYQNLTALCLSIPKFLYFTSQ